MASDYNPVQTVAPNIGSGDNSLNIRANPEAFGAQVGQALQGFGKSISNIGEQQAQINLQKQGLLNETLATNAETEGNNQFGAINADYRNKKGLAAVSAYGETVEKIKAVRQNIRKSLPNAAAQRSFDLLFARQEGFMLRDAGLYKAEQEKQATVHSATASQQQSIDQASNINVATDDEQFGSLLANVKFQTARVVSSQEFGPDSNVGMKQDPKTGDVTFDTSTPMGKQASEIYQEYLDKAIGQVWKNRIEAIAFDPEKHDIKTAVRLLNENAKDIPAAKVAELKKELDGPYRSEITRGAADDITKDADKDFTNSVTSVKTLPPPEGTKTETTKTDEFKGIPYSVPEHAKETNIPGLVNSFIAQESGGKGQNIGQIQPDTWKDFANPGEKIDNPSDNRAVTQRILESYNEKYHGDTARIAVAYFSGPGNVASPGSANPWKEDKTDSNGKTTSSYVSDIINRQGGIQAPSQVEEQRVVPASSRGEYYDEHYGEIMKKVDAYADAHGYDNRQRDELENRVAQNINKVIKAETAQKTAASNLVRRFVFGEDNNGQIISTIGELENGPPEIQQAWRTMQKFDPNGAQALKTKVLTANSRGRQTTYGTQFWERFEDIVEGRIKSVNDLYKYVGPDRNSPLTNTGLTMLMKEYGLGTNQYGVVDPAGQAFLHSELEYFRQLRTDIVGGVNRHNARGERIFQQAVMQALPKIQAARANGAGGEMFDKDSKDYPGGSASYDGRTLDQKLQDFITIQSPTTVGGLLPPEKLPRTEPITTDKFDSITDVTQGRAAIQLLLHDMKTKGQELTPEEYNKLENYLIKRGWASQTPPKDVPVAR